MSTEPQRQTRRNADPTFEDEAIYLLNRIAEDIAPHLAERPQDRLMALQMAWRTVKSYAPGSEAEVLAAGRIVSMSFVQMDLLRETTKRDLTPAMKLRLVRGAVSLNREICQNERLLDRRQRVEERRPARELSPEPARVSRGSGNEAATQALAEQAMEEFRLMQAVQRAQQQDEAAAADNAAAAMAPDAGSAEAEEGCEVDETVAAAGRDIAAEFMRRMSAMERHYDASAGFPNAPLPDGGDPQDDDAADRLAARRRR